MWYLIVDQARGQRGHVAQRVLERRDEVGGVHALQQEAGRPCFDRLEQVVVIGSRAEHDHLDLRHLRFHQPRGAQPVAPRHRHLHQDDVRMLLPGLGQAFEPVGCHADDFDAVRLQDATQALQHQLVIVCQQHSHATSPSVRRWQPARAPARQGGPRWAPRCRRWRSWQARSRSGWGNQFMVVLAHGAVNLIFKISRLAPPATGDRRNAATRRRVRSPARRRVRP